MDNLEPQPSPAPVPQPSHDELQAHVASLASLVNSLLILIFVLAGALDYYLWRQASIARDELNASRQYLYQISRNNTAIEEFARKLADYSKTHPDFAPIANKYGLHPATGAATAAPASGMPAPAPSSATKPKK